MKNYLLILMSIILTSSMVLAAPATRPVKKATRPVARTVTARAVDKNVILTERLTPYATKDEVNTAVNTINAEVGKKADQSYVDAEFGKKADTNYVNTAVSGKADQSEVDTINIKIGTIESDVAKKADAATVTADLALKADKTELISATNTLGIALAEKADKLSLIVYNEETDLYEAQHTAKGLVMTGDKFKYEVNNNGIYLTGLLDGTITEDNEPQFYFNIEDSELSIRDGNAYNMTMSVNNQTIDFSSSDNSNVLYISNSGIMTTSSGNVQFELSLEGLLFGTGTKYGSDSIIHTNPMGEGDDLEFTFPSKSGTFALVEDIPTDTVTAEQVNTLIANAIKAAVETGITIDGVNYKLVVDTVAAQ